MVFVNFHGLTVANATALRRKLREKEVGYMVAKKTILHRALETLTNKPTGSVPQLDGEIAVAYGVDPIWPAKGVQDFKKSLEKGIEIVGGIFEGEYQSAEKMLVVASVPGRDELYGRLAFLLNWPVQRLVMTINQIANK